MFLSLFKVKLNFVLQAHEKDTQLRKYESEMEGVLFRKVDIFLKKLFFTHGILMCSDAMQNTMITVLTILVKFQIERQK